jgi:hypothetical protein|tara:strand:+ start:772 stop:1056 length:285 start_codon:yes stop_codon:yes gene_type:complete
MEVKLKTGRTFKIKENISLDERDDLMDSIEYDLAEDGSLTGVKMMNTTVTRWLRTCIDGDSSDKALIKWSLEERTDAFLKIQKELTLGEEKASK